jgi:PiT family inorganic phosphate transporter
MLSIVVALILVALIFDYINGFHDAANSIATVVSTRVLSPGKAVIWAAFFNFVAAFTFGTAVAKTVGVGMIDVKVVTFAVIFSGLTGAIVWDLITWYSGLPTSSSHALIGGYAGAAVARAGWAAILPAGWTKTLIFIVLSPLIGMALGLTLMTAIFWIFRWVPPSRVDRWFRRAQLVSAAFFSLNHGANDAQKTMGIIAGVLYAAGLHSDLRHSVLGGAGSAHRDRPWHARRRVANYSHLWARRSPSCSRSAALPLKPARRCRS